MEVKGLCSAHKIKNVSFEVRAGEIVGLGGLVGCGKAEVARAIFGLQAIDAGQIVLDGESIKAHSPAAMLKRGMVYLPQDRRGEALALNRPIAENMSIEVLGEAGYAHAGFVRTAALVKLVNGLLARLKVQPAEPNKAVQELSGGNQQKVVLGRALSRKRTLYMFDEPTAGIDVGARLDFYYQLKRLCAEGAAILLITSDLQELVHLSHRVHVMHEGSCTASLEGDGINEESVIAYAFGETPKKDLQ
ncbi:ABC-type sugar transport system ATPase subunit [Bradyrhizobium sp. GM0.4]